MIIAETIPPHRVLTTPFTDKEESVARLSARIEEDFFNRTPSPPKTSQRYHKPYIESALHTPIGQKAQSHYIETASERAEQSCFPVRVDSSYGNSQGTPTQTDQNISLPIRRKEVRLATLRRRASSSETVIHNIGIEQPFPVELLNNLGIAATPPLTPRLEVTTPGKTTRTLSLTSPTIGEEPFLDIAKAPSECEGLQENEAIVTSYQSASMSQALTHLPWLQNPKDTFQANRIPSLKEFPPVVLKDPLSARIPSNPRSHETPIPSPALKSIPRFPQQERGKLNGFWLSNRSG
jgi:hypothetical protein